MVFNFLCLAIKAACPWRNACVENVGSSRTSVQSHTIRSHAGNVLCVAACKMSVDLAVARVEHRNGFTRAACDSSVAYEVGGHFPTGLNIHADVVSSVRAVYVRFFFMAQTFIWKWSGMMP